MRAMLSGAAVGVIVGYAAVRQSTAFADRREPLAAVAAPDPKRYGRTRRSLLVVGVLRSLASIMVTAEIVAPPLERALSRLPVPLRAPAFAAALGFMSDLRELGVSYVEGHVLERTYGMTDQTARSWAADHLKGSAVGLVVSALIAGLGHAVVRREPERWPAIVIGAAPVLLALANVIAPTFIMPLFNTYKPIEGELATQIRALADRYGAGDAAILRFDMSRQTKKANAFVTGIFGTKRIVLADTLIEHFEPDETLFVVAHELGHYVRKDPWRSIALGTAFTAITILGARAMLSPQARRLETLTDATRFALYGSLVTTVLAPITAAFSRNIERAADGFAIDATDDPRSGARAFRRLRERNLAEDEQPKWAELLFSTHPSLKSRIERLEAAL